MPERFDLSSALFAVFSLLYPLIAVATVRAFGPGAALFVLLSGLGLRLVAPVSQAVPVSLGLSVMLVFAAIVAVGTFDRQLSVRLYPVFMNVAMLAAFALTLRRPPSMVERFARIFEPDLPPSGVRYTYRVTTVWVGFFALNGAVALWSALQPGWAAWTLYNGVISYIAVGTLIAGEYAIRRLVRRTS
ncbi:MAG TPA: hypothetical protein VHX61_19520 [Rhizomicrobium sp.]|jgi:uncharacterized membrane protein|nr:hypothetical protein [Rhizomicrobium sp.]